MYIKNNIYIFNKKLPETALNYRQGGGREGGVWLRIWSASLAVLRTLTTSVLFPPLLSAHSPGTWLLEVLSGKRFANAPSRWDSINPECRGPARTRSKVSRHPVLGRWSAGLDLSGFMHKAGRGSGNPSWRRTERNQVWTEQGLWEPCAEAASWANSWPSGAFPRGSSGLADVRGPLGQAGPGGWSAPRESASGGPGGKAGGAGGSRGVSAVKQVEVK